jgi:hypothetical protein
MVVHGQSNIGQSNIGSGRPGLVTVVESLDRVPVAHVGCGHLVVGVVLYPAILCHRRSYVLHKRPSIGVGHKR